MSFFSLWFVAFLVVLLLGWQAFTGRAHRRALFTLANGAFLATLLPDLPSALALLLFIAAGYGALRLVAARPGTPVGTLAIVLAVLALVWLKRYEFLAAVAPPSVLQHTLEVIGISYLTFRLIHMIVDLRQGQLAPFTFLSYANYQLSFLGLLAGPIQRYNMFAEFWSDPAPTASEEQGARAWIRVMSGLMYLGVAAPVALYLHNGFRARVTTLDTLPALAAFFMMLYAYPAFVYFNFAGYCHVVIGSAGLLGMQHQENFDRPWRARNLVDFWNRWHISLTMWIRDYLFTPMYKSVAERAPAQAARAGYALLFLALLLAGLWHGSTANFAVFGLLHGAGVAIVQIYGDTLKAAIGRARFKTYMAHPWARAAAVVVTFHYVCFTFLFFQVDLEGTLDLLREAGSRFF